MLEVGVEIHSYIIWVFSFFFSDLYPPVLAWMTDIPCCNTGSPWEKMALGAFLEDTSVPLPFLLGLLVFFKTTPSSLPPLLGLPFTLLGTPTPPGVQFFCKLPLPPGLPLFFGLPPIFGPRCPTLPFWPPIPLFSLQPLYCITTLPKLPLLFRPDIFGQRPLLQLDTPLIPFLKLP